MGDFLLFFQVFYLFAHEDEIRIGFGTGLMSFQQLLHKRRQAGEAAMSHRAYLIPGQRLVQCAFSNVFNCVQRREANIRLHSAVLGTVAGDAVKLGVSQFYLAVFDRLQGLDGTLAKGAVAN